MCVCAGVQHVLPGAVPHPGATDDVFEATLKLNPRHCASAQHASTQAAMVACSPKFGTAPPAAHQSARAIERLNMEHTRGPERDGNGGSGRAASNGVK